MKTLLKYFVRGAVILVPMAATGYVVYLTLKTVDGLLRLPVPGLGIFVTGALITLIGFLASNEFFAGLIVATDGALKRVPLVRLLYTSTRDLMGAFVGNKKKFDRPVLVSLTADHALRALGFVTREALQGGGFEGMVTVYFPQSYNFAGNVVLVARERITPVEAGSADVMAFVVSGGVSGLRGKPADASSTVVPTSAARW
jgi:uncharacterized membrane protein